jgi:Na+/H+ antiporter NhaC
MNEDTESNKNEDKSINIIDFIKNNFFQIILFILVFIIIYIVDRITFHNANLMILNQQKIMKEQMKQFKKKIKNYNKK